MITDIDPVTNAYWIANNMEAKRYEYDLEPEDLVIDLGAHTGEFATKIHDKYGCRVICAEPTGAADHLEYHSWANVIRAAVSIDDQPQKFGGNSYYTTALEPGDTIYNCFDILKLMDQDIALLKMNIEGSEWQVMRRIIDYNKHPNVKYFQIQFHRINELSDLSYSYLAAELMKTHKLMWRVAYCWESWVRK